MTRLNIRMDEGLRKKAEDILDELGLNMSSAVNIFIRQLVRQGGLPFTPTLTTQRTAGDEMQERIDALLKFAADRQKIVKEYQFVRDDCYER